MKVSIERSALLKAMSRAQGVVERRNTIPILANVLLEADGAELSLRATDLDVELPVEPLHQIELPPPEPRPPLWKNWWFWGGVAAGAAILGTTLAVVLRPEADLIAPSGTLGTADGRP